MRDLYQWNSYPSEGSIKNQYVAGDREISSLYIQISLYQGFKTIKEIWYDGRGKITSL